MANLNVKRLERDIEKYIPVIIQRETSDDLLKSITITGCKLAHDLSYCKVYFTSLLKDVDQKVLIKEVNEASAFIRGKLAKMIDARNTPVLNFEYDTSIEYAQKIESIISNLNK